MASSFPEQAIITRLLADSNITGIVSARIYYMEVPADPTYPYVFMQMIDDPDESHIIGADGSNPRFQIDSIDRNTTLTNVKALDNYIRSSLNEFSGTMDGITFYKIMPGGYRELPESGGIIRLSRDFLVMWER